MRLISMRLREARAWRDAAVRDRAEDIKHAEMPVRIEIDVTGSKRVSKVGAVMHHDADELRRMALGEQWAFKPVVYVDTEQRFNYYVYFFEIEK
jgi:hypothetical protein